MSETIQISKLKRHPRNYNHHPNDQLEHIIQSIKEDGIYRNIVIAKDNTILAGHGVVQAATKMGLTEIEAVRLDIEPDSPRALKVLVKDNEISHLSEKDDRALTELLKEIGKFDLEGLLGTGYDEMMLANLVLVTRPAGEIADLNEAAEWVGMPEYAPGEDQGSIIKVSVNFRTMEDKMEFARVLGLKFTPKTDTTWWPAKERNDLASVRFEGINE